MNEGPSTWIDTVTIDGRTQTIKEYIEEKEKREKEKYIKRRGKRNCFFNKKIQHVNQKEG